ncbi:MAG: response regulator [Fibrobacterota bacterium]
MSHRILVIEDEAGIRDNLREMLEAEGFDVDEAESGLDGIRQALARLPDLVVCDVMMPVKDGFEVLADLRGRESTSHLPFLFLTARADRGSLRKGMELGAEDYLTKPFSRTELLAAVRTRLDRAESLAATYRRQLGTLRNTLSRALPHELLTPLNGILGLSGILVSEYETVHRGEMLDIAKGISDSGEALHRLVRRFLCYAEMEMALLDPAVRDRLRGHASTEIENLLKKSTAHLPNLRITIRTKTSPAIAPDHLEVLLREILDLEHHFDEATIDDREGRWILTLHDFTPPESSMGLGDDGSDLSRALLSSACRVYDAVLDRSTHGERTLSIPLAAKSQKLP